MINDMQFFNHPLQAIHGGLVVSVPCQLRLVRKGRAIESHKRIHHKLVSRVAISKSPKIQHKLVSREINSET